MSSSHNTCSSCKKKSILIGKCRCDKNVCLKCRYPENHNCTFDYQNENQKKLEKENPTITSEKLVKV